MRVRCLRTCNDVGLSKSQTALVFPSCSHLEEEWGPLLLCRLQETKWCHKEWLYPTALDWRHSQRRLSTVKAVTGKRIYIRTTRRRLCSWWVKGYGSSQSWPLPLQHSSNIWAVNGDCLTRPHKSFLMYLNDVTVIGRTFQEHLLNLWKEFQQFWEAHLKLKPQKC
jgi:hypothetical protein